MNNTERYKKFTILHSNDMHGDFLEEMQGKGGSLIGGLARLSGYIAKVRQEEKNVLYAIAGDMLQGSMIDAEYKGISTMEIMNYLAPDVATLGNHEFEYGLPHLLFLEKIANFPIVNANLYIEKYHRRLMKPYHIINIDGFDVMFIGIITDEVLKELKHDTGVGSFINLADAAAEVGRICDAYKNDDIDLTILLTHIGFEEDKKLAAMLDPIWGVDMILGGHSHTILDQPAQVNGILIAQAGVGTDQIGRFDIVVDDDTNSIVEWKWQLIPVNETLAKVDVNLKKMIDSYKDVVDKKFNTPITRFSNVLTHPTQSSETELGNLFADIMQYRSQADLVLFASFAIRGTELGPLLTLGKFLESIPYDDALLKCTLLGSDLKTIWEYLLRPENQAGAGYFFQVNKGVELIYNNSLRSLEKFSIQGAEVENESQYVICLQKYHYEDSTLKHYGLAMERFTFLGHIQVVATSMRNVYEEYLRSNQNKSSSVEGRIKFIS